MPTSCPFCQNSVLDDGSLAGQRVKCPHCGQAFTMPPATAIQPMAAAPKPAPNIVTNAPSAGAPPAAAPSAGGFPGISKGGNTGAAAKYRKKKSSPLPIILFVGLGGGAVVLLVGMLVVMSMFVGDSGGGVAFQSNYDKHDAAMKKFVNEFDKFTDALESVEDPQSARVAAGKIDNIVDRLKKLEKEIDRLPNITTSEDRRLEKKYGQRLKNMMSRLEQSASQAGRNSGGDEKFIAAMERFSEWASSASFDEF